jgi:hypothetical protein
MSKKKQLKRKYNRQKKHLKRLRKKSIVTTSKDVFSIFEKNMAYILNGLTTLNIDKKDKNISHIKDRCEKCDRCENCDKF